MNKIFNAEILTLPSMKLLIFDSNNKYAIT